MASFNSKKANFEGKGLRYKLLIVWALVFILPMLTLGYFLYTNNVSLKVSHAFIFALILVLILSGFIIVRQIFDKLIMLVALIKEAEADETTQIDTGKETAELHEISLSLNNIMRKFEQTTNELKQRVFELFTIKELIEAVGKKLDIDDLLNVLLNKAMAVSRAQIGSVFMVESETQRFRVVASRGWEPVPEKNSCINISDSLARLVVSDKKPLLVQDIETDPRIQKPNDPKYGPPSFLSIPIFIEEDVTAVLNLANKETKQLFNEDDEQVLAIIISEISFALENALLHSRIGENLRHMKERTAELEQEITKRSRVEEALGESENKYKTLYESSQDAIMLLTPEEGFFNGNLAAVEMFGCKDEKEFTSKTPADSSPEYQPNGILSSIKAQEMMAIALEKGSHFFEWRHKRVDGTEFFTTVLLTIMELKGKKVLQATVRDITEQKKMEEELLKAQKLDSIGVLAGGIAHDFNNILTAILGNITMAKMDVKPEDKVFKKLENAEKASLRAKDLTQQLLTFSKGGAPIKKTASISELIKDSASFALRGSNVRCEFSLPDNLWLVEVDEGQISQVIHNLILNADQVMPEGGTIRVGAENIALSSEHGLPLRDGKYVKITVKDYGPGIPVEHLPKIFDPYFTTKQIGSGLGLATAYSIIRKHDGYIIVESVLGAGTRFYIYLPASEKEVVKKKDIEEGSIVGKGRILVMDDEELVREVAGEMIKSIGYGVKFARDGAEAIETYKKARESGEPFNAVIMDLTIPGGMGGKEAVKKLLEIDPEVKSIVSSGYSNDPIMAEFREYGFSGVITKPYKIGELSKILHKVITEISE